MREASSSDYLPLGPDTGIKSLGKVLRCVGQLQRYVRCTIHPFNHVYQNFVGVLSHFTGKKQDLVSIWVEKVG